jgi:hypothetical protein
MSEDKWISVKDRLPKEGERVLVTIEFDKPNFRGERRKISIDKVQCGCWLLEWADETITHWQPLPDLPKELRNKE